MLGTFNITSTEDGRISLAHGGIGGKIGEPFIIRPGETYTLTLGKAYTATVAAEEKSPPAQLRHTEQQLMELRERLVMLLIQNRGEIAIREIPQEAERLEAHILRAC